MMLFIVLLSVTFAGDILVFGQPAFDANVEFAENVKNGITKLSTEFFKILFNESSPEENFVFSPLNIYTVLALVHLGATGTTKNEISDALAFPAEDSKSAAAHQYLGRLLNKIQNSADGLSTVNIANGIFVQKELKLKEEYVNRTLNYYKNELQQVDFASGAPEATNTINKWIGDNTKNRIPNMFENTLPTNTIILLASALYFADTWKFAFSKTKIENFNTGTKLVLVPTMSAEDKILHAYNSNLRSHAISIPYSKEEFSMLIMLPHRKESVKTFINSLKPEHILETINSLKITDTPVLYVIPRFKFRWMRDINQHLEKLGIKRMLKKAELDNMMDLTDDVESKVTHAAEIDVRENGTLAASTTTVLFKYQMLVSFHVDRPFLFSIYHQNTSTILFTGLVQNPVNENT